MKQKSQTQEDFGSLNESYKQKQNSSGENKDGLYRMK